MFARSKPHAATTPNEVLHRLADHLEQAAADLRRIAGDAPAPAKATTLDDLDNMRIDLAHLEADD